MAAFENVILHAFPLTTNIMNSLARDKQLIESLKSFSIYKYLADYNE